jgi:hypothetical protein
MQQFTAVIAMYAWLAATWLGRLHLLIVFVAVLGVPTYEAHLRGLARLQRAGLRRNVDVDGVRLEGEELRRAGSPDAAPDRDRVVS